MTLTGTERVAVDARRRGLAIEIVERPAADSLEAAARLLGLTPSDVIKSLVVKRHDGDYLFVLTPGDRQISWSKLRTLLGVNKLSLPAAELALEATGYERGTITPLGSLTPLPVYADERMIGKQGRARSRRARPQPARRRRCASCRVRRDRRRSHRSAEAPRLTPG